MAHCELIVFGAWEYHDLPICHLKKKMKMVYGWALLNNFEFFQRNKNMNQITTQQQHVDLA